jgi:beta-hydroxylase
MQPVSPQPTELTENAKRAALVPKKPLVMRIGKRIQPWVNSVVANASLIGNSPFYDTQQFAWVAQLEQNWEVIKQEAEAALYDLSKVPPLATISPDHRRIAPANKWRAFFLYGYGYRTEGNCLKCPRTAALVETVPGLNSAFFSILAPGTHIAPHTGVTKSLITCHLGIKVPRDGAKCQMRVVDQYTGWTPGKALVFDDVYPHEVRNDSDEDRIILLVQFKRPVSLSGKIVGGLFLWGVKRSRFIQEARRGLREWSE